MLAPAKINLTLHVGRVIADADRFHGYHPLDSLVVFADVGDELSIEPAAEPGLTVDGPYADGLPDGEDNLVLRALRAANRVEPGAGDRHVRLTKTLPVASGLGGGSADAAATLRACLPGHPDLMETALSLGADVPACVLGRTLRMTGIGDTLSPLPGLGSVAAVLANPGVAVSTPEVFRRFDADTRPDWPREAPRPQAHEGDLLARALDGRNDLEPAATAMEPGIAELTREMAAAPGCRLARMSGSGASVFGLFEDDARARAFADGLAASRGIWAVACRLGDAPG